MVQLSINAAVSGVFNIELCVFSSCSVLKKLENLPRRGRTILSRVRICSLLSKFQMMSLSKSALFFELNSSVQSVAAATWGEI